MIYGGIVRKPLSPKELKIKSINQVVKRGYSIAGVVSA